MNRRMLASDAHSDDASGFAQMNDATPAEQRWVDICKLERINPGTGVAAMIDGEQIAIVKTRDGQLYALSNFDPFSKAFVIARGIVGDREGTPKIASPIFKQTFDLRSGQCLEDPGVRLPVFETRVMNGRIQVLFPSSRRLP
jgi:nitrite reductase (NADH) small subunit